MRFVSQRSLSCRKQHSRNTESPRDYTRTPSLGLGSALATGWFKSSEPESKHKGRNSNWKQKSTGNCSCEATGLSPRKCRIDIVCKALRIHQEAWTQSCSCKESSCPQHPLGQQWTTPVMYLALRTAGAWSSALLLPRTLQSTSHSNWEFCPCRSCRAGFARGTQPQFPCEHSFSLRVSFST